MKTQASTSAQNMQTFLDSNIPGIRIQVNATAETQPGQNITVMLCLKRQNQTGVYVEYFNLSVFGFVNGTYKILMANITGDSFSLGSSPSRYNRTFAVPQQVWDVTYGEITLTYNATYSVAGIQTTILYQNITSGFTMTHVENVYLKSIEEQLANLQAQYNQLHENYTALQGNLSELNETYWKSFQMNLTVDNLAYINRTYWELQQNYTALQGNLSELQARYNSLQQNYTTLEGSLSDLNNTRSAVAVLAITSIFFLATTVYLIMRKPKEDY
jgi:prefoldin subunit 5